MNTRLAAGSGMGLVVGAAVGVIVDAIFGADGMAMVLGAAIGIALGFGVAAATGERSKDAE